MFSIESIVTNAVTTGVGLSSSSNMKEANQKLVSWANGLSEDQRKRLESKANSVASANNKIRVILDEYNKSTGDNLKTVNDAKKEFALISIGVTSVVLIGIIYLARKNG
jgi:hypothetical protein